MSLLELRNISKKYKDTVALNDVNLRLEKNRIYGLIGVNGAGKTTLIKIITGVIFPTNGIIKLFEKSESNELTKCRKRVSATIETPSFYQWMSVEENVKLACIENGIIYGKEVKDIFDELQILGEFKKKTKNLSLGMKQKLGLGIALIKDPDLLILDEPTNGVDPVSVIKLRSIFRTYIEKNNKTILISSHILTELYEIATDFIFIEGGRIIQIISKDTLMQGLDSCIVTYGDNIKEIYNTLLIDFPQAEYKFSNNSIEIRKGNSQYEESEIVKKLRLNNYEVVIKKDNLENYMIRLMEDGDEKIN